MSNSLAIATVSAVLRARIQGWIEAANLTGFAVTTAPPAPDSPPGVYVHLYQINPNAGLRNETMPERAAAGSVRRPPRLAIDLNYALSFAGAPANNDAERLAGLVLLGLNEAPLLMPAEIGDFVSTLPAGHALAGSDLANQVEVVRLTMVPLDLEDLSRLWGMHAQAVHRLTVAYRATVVMLDAQLPSGTALPVTQDPALTIFQLRRPRITTARSSMRNQPVVRFGEELVVEGVALAADRTVLVLGGHRIPLTSPGDTEIRFTFDAASGLRAGVTGVQIVHEVELPDGTTRVAATSGLLPVALVPTIVPAVPATAPGVGPDGEPRLFVRLTVNPIPDPQDQLTLELSGPAGSLTSWSDWQLAGDAVVVSTAGLPAGRHLARLKLGGALSLLDVDPETGAFLGPAITVP